jgi:hypothetical protein
MNDTDSWDPWTKGDNKREGNAFSERWTIEICPDCSEQWVGGAEIRLSLRSWFRSLWPLHLVTTFVCTLTSLGSLLIYRLYLPSPLTACSWVNDTEGRSAALYLSIHHVVAIVAPSFPLPIWAQTRSLLSRKYFTNWIGRWDDRDSGYNRLTIVCSVENMGKTDGVSWGGGYRNHLVFPLVIPYEDGWWWAVVIHEDVVTVLTCCNIEGSSEYIE